MTSHPPPPPRATMREVASAAGVSLKTVSRVVNGEPGVREVVRREVEAVVEELGYRHHRGASDLRRSGQRTRAIGVLVQDIANDYSARLLRSLEDATRERGFVLLAASLDEDAARERQLVTEMIARRVDGLVLMAATDRQDYLAADVRAGLPVVFVDRVPHGLDVDCVTIDNAGGTRAGVEHLLGRGHRRIAFLGDLPAIPTARERLAGWRQALVAAGATPDPALVRDGLRTVDAARDALGDLLRLPDPPTAVFAARNVLTVGCLRAVRWDAPAPAPEVVGFDDVELLDLLEPRTTVVRQDVEAVGRAAADLLERRMAAHGWPARHVVLPTELVVR
ncbi:LacI family DNA-binding transcriptional regulator [Kineococcus sp. TBRC 1896]|uniref:LacI family DNA-binding transcriptional regulator n=1 Tax=Kineococcus mangrovi TaxID=1660183 RepID=A0ABV4I7N4_9ACTN